MLKFFHIFGLLLLVIVSCCATEEKKDQLGDHHDHAHDAEHHKEHEHNHDPEHHHDGQPKVLAEHKPDEPEVPHVEIKTTEKPAVTEEQPNSSKVPKDDDDEVEVHEVPSKEHPILAADSSVGRQFAPMYQPMFPQPAGGFNMIRRQFGGGMELLGDIVMMGMIGLPILGLLTVGSSSIANFLGFGSSSSSKSSSKRTRRSLKEKAAGAVEYAKNLWDVMEQLERAFEKYDLYQVECRLQAVCEAHQKVPRLGAWGQTIIDLMRKQKELESREILPVSRFLFSNYADAAQVGSRGGDCSQLFTGCPHHLSYFVSAKEDEVQNEVEVGMK